MLSTLSDCLCVVNFFLMKLIAHLKYHQNKCNFVCKVYTNLRETSSRGHRTELKCILIRHCDYINNALIYISLTLNKSIIVLAYTQPKYFKINECSILYIHLIIIFRSTDYSFSHRIKSWRKDCHCYVWPRKQDCYVFDE